MLLTYASVSLTYATWVTFNKTEGVKYPTPGQNILEEKASITIAKMFKLSDNGCKTVTIITLFLIIKIR